MMRSQHWIAPLVRFSVSPATKFYRKSSDFFAIKISTSWISGNFMVFYPASTLITPIKSCGKIHILAWITFEGSLVQGILVDQIAQSGKGKTQLCKVVVLPPKLVERWWWRCLNGMLKGERSLRFHIFFFYIGYENASIFYVFHPMITMICIKNHLHNGFVRKFGAPFRIPGVAVGPKKMPTTWPPT